MSVPLPIQGAFPHSPWEVASRLKQLPGFVFLDSQARQPGALSLLAALPTAQLSGKLPDLAPLRDAIARYATPSPAPRPAARPGRLPAGALIGSFDFDGSYSFGLYPEILAYDHSMAQWWSNGPQLPDLVASSSRPIPSHSSPWHGIGFSPSLSPDHFQSMVRRAREYIAAGDIYQVNLAQPFSSSQLPPQAGWQLFSRLRQISPAPYGAYLNQPSHDPSAPAREIISSSPELFLDLRHDLIRTEPIKGTRRRSQDPAADQALADALRSSPKERAELLMITDLERNDLGRVCRYGSISVPHCFKLASFPHLWHLFSVVEGQLRDEFDHPAALQACFPGGSISGAPKLRALEIIAELEPAPRGIFTGAIGYFGLDQISQFNIAIRTVERSGDEMRFWVGAGIVADSTPEAEYQETLDKAAGILKAAQPSPLPQPHP